MPGEEKFYDVPVVMFVYKRPDLTRKSFEAIRHIRPSKLYIVCDGPKTKKDEAAVKEVRDFLDTAVDWPCEVHRDYATRNMGLRYRIPSGIKHVFEKEDRAVFVEDDIEGSDEFFRFCREMLEHYKDDEQVMMVAGTNILPDHPTFGDYDICFSCFSHIWGWASWKRAWETYDTNMLSWPKLRKDRTLEKNVFNKKGYAFYKWIFDDLQYQWYNSWGYVWLYHMLSHGGMGIVPKKNLVNNIGMGNADGEHPDENDDRVDYVSSLPKGVMSDEYKLPPEIVRNTVFDEEFQDKYVLPGLKPLEAAKRSVRTYLNHKAFLTICEMEKDAEYFDKYIPDEKKLSPEEIKWNDGEKYRQIDGKTMRRDAAAYRKYKKKHK